MGGVGGGGWGCVLSHTLKITQKAGGPILGNASPSSGQAKRKFIHRMVLQWTNRGDSDMLPGAGGARTPAVPP